MLQKQAEVCRRNTSPTPSFCGGEPEDTTYDLLEEVSLQMGMSPQSTFQIHWIKQITLHMVSITSGYMSTLDMTPGNWMCYCIQHQSDSRGGGGDQPPPSHAWSGSLIANMF